MHALLYRDGYIRRCGRHRLENERGSAKGTLVNQLGERNFRIENLRVDGERTVIQKKKMRIEQHTN